MIDFAAVLTASVVCVAGVMSPGPNFVAVTHRAVTSHRAEALAMVGGIVCVNALWASAALFGLGILFALFPWLFWSVKLLGTAYLVWFGIQLLRRAGTPLADKNSLPSQSTCARAFRDGIVTNLSNPKSMAFYASVFSAAVPAAAATDTLAAMVAMVACIALFWYGGVAFVLSTERAANVYRKGKPAIERTCGVFLIAFGLRQALARP
jgi:threonine/homoserine/homoserine lactone efflux protein